MSAEEHNPFTEHYIERKRVTRERDPSQVQVLFSVTLESDLAVWRRKGFTCIGVADVAGKAGEMGVSQRMRLQAARVGADVVLFCSWPAKVRAVRRGEDGEIDLDAVLADPPASFSSRSYSVSRAFFLAQL